MWIFIIFALVTSYWAGYVQGRAADLATARVLLALTIAFVLISWRLYH
jgi:hypothetical protein